MRLAQDETRIIIDEKTTIRLRPTLRAAMRLERRYGGFDKILRGITTGSVTIVADVIRESADHSTPVPEVFTAIGPGGLGVILKRLKEYLVPHVMALAGLDDEIFSNKKERREAAAMITFAEHHARLYRIATGWLNWPPETAWNATPAEITEAYTGHVEKLKAIYGSSDKADKPKAAGGLAHKFRAVFGARGTKIVGKAA